MKLSQFKYNLPEALIAKHPVPNRDEARLMVLHRKERKIEHKLFKDILDIFSEDDVFILNNTKVFPARLYGNKEKTGANDDLVAEVVDNTTSRGRTIRFLFDGSDDEFRNLIEKLGETPIPRYLGRDVEKDDKDRYQTIFAKEEGAVAPPAAGLHFSRELMMRMEIKGIKFTDVTLHIGLGTFRDVEVEDLTKHKMDSENYTITQKTADLVNNALDNKSQRIVAVGSSVMRAVQSSVSSMNRLNQSGGWTDKFIFPPYDFKIANAFITNFHPSEATLLMQTAAFADYDFLMEAYKEAIKEKYRFLCYGDAMLIL
jgi:S-adenosylmethionine:tRNA ribosyltransferase-isomerase